MRSELANKIMMLFFQYGITSETLKAEVLLLLNEFEVDRKTTELTLYDNLDYNLKAFQQFLVAKTVKGLTENTIEHYKHGLQFIFDRIDKPVNLVTSDDIRLYFAKRQIQDKVSFSSINNEMNILSSFFAWMQSEELIDKNPMLKVEKVKMRKQKKKAFSDAECELLRDSCRDLRERALVEVLFSTWCRVTEVESMNISDIDRDQMIVIGKGQKERIVYLNAKAQLAIKKYLDTRTDNNPALFAAKVGDNNRISKSQIEKSLKRLGEIAGVENCHPHRFRRTGATLALRKGMPIEKVSYLLGHDSLETTKIYLDLNEEDAKLAHKKYVN